MHGYDLGLFFALISYTAKKNKKSPAGGKENKKRKTPSTEARQSITAQHDELVVTEILGACPTMSEPAELIKMVTPAHSSLWRQTTKTEPSTSEVYQCYLPRGKGAANRRVRRNQKRVG